MDRSKARSTTSKVAATGKAATKKGVRKSAANKPAKNATNPPRTTKGWLTSPKFGSAGSGGAEFEPGPERD